MTTIAEAARIAATTGIGSLPHHNVDAALEHSFRMGIPFLPQIPIRNPWEFMIAQALEGLPGLQAEKDGTVELNAEVWGSRAADFGRCLDAALEDPSRLERFEPSASVSSCWQPFVWELTERGTKVAKIQIAGPVTCQWAIRTKGDLGEKERNALSSQVLKLVLARALAMSRRISREGARPILFLDEPGLSVLSPPELFELRLLAQALNKEGVWVGLHCCGRADWKAILGLPIRFLSIDAALSLDGLLENENELTAFAAGGGRLALGVVPTGRSAVLRSWDPDDALEDTLGKLDRGLAGTPGLSRRVLSEALFTPACGLALQSVGETELILGSLSRFEERANAAGRPGN